MRLYHIVVRIQKRSEDFPYRKTVEERTYTAFGKRATTKRERELRQEFRTATIESKLQGLHVRQPVCP